MKKIVIMTGLLLGMAGVSQATLFSYNYSGGSVIVPDGNQNGLATAITVADIPAQIYGENATIVNVDVRLTITGGYNGDLYGYLVLQSTDASTTSVLLLNRIGTGGGNVFGSSGAGFSNVTLSDSGALDIHGATGVPTGVWQTDQSLGAHTLGGALTGVNANGTWTLFLADLAGGDQSTLVSWGLDITVVPEPAAWALGIFGGLAGLGLLGRRLRLAV